ncbi:MAG: hypothetical protein HY923_10335 [Elusimicrobia bacterium]|nr:hypothetical protein [Elusimicrobiota bacterium]
MERLFKNGCGRWQFGGIEAGARGYFLLDTDTTAILYLCEGMRARLPEGGRSRGGMI